MAPGTSVHFDDLPEPLRPRGDARVDTVDWERQLAAWAEAQFAAGATGLAPRAQAALERALTDAALARAQGQRGEAARLLGWGRNTLARKLKGRKP